MTPIDPAAIAAQDAHAVVGGRARQTRGGSKWATYSAGRSPRRPECVPRRRRCRETRWIPPDFAPTAPVGREKGCARGRAHEGEREDQTQRMSAPVLRRASHTCRGVRECRRPEAPTRHQPGPSRRHQYERRTATGGLRNASETDAAVHGSPGIGKSSPRCLASAAQARIPRTTRREKPGRCAMRSPAWRYTIAERCSQGFPSSSPMPNSARPRIDSATTCSPERWATSDTPIIDVACSSTSPTKIWRIHFSLRWLVGTSWAHFASSRVAADPYATST